MTAASTFLTYVWHYLIARALYDELLRPLLHGRPTPLLLVVCVAAAAFVLGRVTRRRA